MALSASANGHTYRLRQATFAVTGPTTVSLDSEAQPDAAALTAALTAGSYTITLAGPWFLERLAAAGPVKVDATLTSSNPAAFTIAAGTTTAVAFSFATEGSIVTVGTGTLSVSVDVTETGVNSPPGLSLLAGKLGASASGDGTGADARFGGPAGIVADGQGNLFVADTFISVIRKVVIATGEVTTLAGSPGIFGITDGTGAEASFGSPQGLAVDGGDLYVADTNSNTIRKVVIATGEVTTFIGTPGNFGNQDGVGNAATLAIPTGLASDGAGNLYVVDLVNDTVRKIEIATATVTTIAGSPQAAGFADGVGAAARFSGPEGVASDGAGNLYVADTFNAVIRKVVIATGEVTTLAGSPGVFSVRDGNGQSALFGDPWGITSDGAGSFYVADAGSDAIRKIDIGTALVTTVAGDPGVFGSSDGAGNQAHFSDPEGVAADGTGAVFVADTENFTIRRVDPATNQVTTLAGAALGIGNVDGTGPAARFDGPADGVADGAGNLYVSDSAANNIRKIVLSTGEVTTLAGRPGSAGNIDGAGNQATFDGPDGLAVDGAGNLYVADSFNSTIRKVVLATGEVSTLTGSPGVRGEVDGPTVLAQFDIPTGLASDGAGNIYVFDALGPTVRKIVLATSQVTTIAGTPNVFGSDDGVGAAASFGGQSFLACDGANLYISDFFNNTIRKLVLATGQVTTLAGTAGQAGSTDGTGAAARFNQPEAGGFDPATGSLYVADSLSNAVRKIDVASGVVTTVVGTPGHAGVLLGALPARLDRPGSATVLGSGAIAITDESSVLVARF
jgi:sugar lactone lactonase YvrE